jgi:hypothetical protein
MTHSPERGTAYNADSPWKQNVSATGVALWKWSHCKAVRHRDTVEVIVLASNTYYIKNKLFLRKSKIIFVNTFASISYKYIGRNEVLTDISRLESSIVYNLKAESFGSLIGKWI